MSSSTLTTIQKQLNLYAYPIFMILGNIGNAFIVIIFARQRQNPCSIYLISSAIMNSIYITFYNVIQIVSLDYQNGTTLVIALCKIEAYGLAVFGQVAKTMVIAACIDRFMITSNRVTFRALSTSKRAKQFVFFSFLFWLLVNIHIPIMLSVVNGQCGSIGIYSIIFSIYVLITVVLIPSGMIGVFGYLTYRNMREMYVRVQPIAQHAAGTGNIGIRQRDRDLLIIVIAEAMVYVITTVPFTLYLLETMVSQNIGVNKNIQYLQIEGFISTITYLFLYINSAVSFYVYLLSSKPFRRDFKQSILSCYQKLKRQPPILPVMRAHMTL